MSETPQSAPQPPDDGNGRRWKWLGAAAVATVLLGGWYVVTKSMSRPERPIETAAIERPYETPASGGVSTAPDAANQGATVDAAGADAAPVDPAAAPAKPSPRRTPVAGELVPEEVVGVTPASVTTGDENEVVVTAQRRPVWTQTPSARRLSALYPARALERGREGEASVRCTVKENGALDCVRGAEYPANSGFGTAALRVASKFRHGPRRSDGSIAAGTPVNLRVVFRIEEDSRRRG